MGLAVKGVDEAMAKKILVMTVGMGVNADPQNSLYAPLERSMRQARPTAIWLFPSQLSERHAQHLQATLGEMPIQVAPALPVDAEEDPDLCFRYFEGRIQEILATGVKPREIVMDYTRGTKTMSAAALLAALRHGIDRFAYVSGERGENNLVLPGKERIREFSAAYITAQREMELAERLMRLQRYSAIETVLSGSERRYPETLRAAAGRVRACAAFWDAWDRLDYRAAGSLLEEARAGDAWFAPGEEAGRAISLLAAERPNEPAQCHGPTWALVFDILENARRRLAQGQYEDALLRIYRGLELMGQAELYRYGIETDGTDPEREEICRWLDYRRKEGSRIPEIVPKKRGYELSKDLVGSLLKFLKSPLARDLNNFDQNRDFQAKLRNTSLLIHGFSIKATRKTVKELEGMLTVGLPSIARKGVPDELRWIERAVRFPGGGKA